MSTALLASYACDPAQSRGRRFAEQAAPTRSDFQRDRDRIVHSTAFRRLVYKTQVFLNHEGDLFRTRLTHSLEVAQLGRSIARALGLNEDLVEAIALAHDLGHTPFGHAGQDALNACMAQHGGHVTARRSAPSRATTASGSDGMHSQKPGRTPVLGGCRAEGPCLERLLRSLPFLVHLCAELVHCLRRLRRRQPTESCGNHDRRRRRPLAQGGHCLC